MSKIFLSYRRVDSAPYAGRIYDHLSNHFGAEQIFMDIDTIKPGVDFVEVLENAVQQCDALIAVIGRQWLTVTDAAGNRRLDDPHDFTRLEVEAALNRNIRVFPVLVDGAEMPRTSDLPESLAKLTRRNALTISNERFGYDISKLIDGLDEVVAKIPEKAATHIQTSRPASANGERKRSIWLNLYLVLTVLGNLFFIIQDLVNYGYPSVEISLVLIAAIAISGLTSIVGILMWKKWGVTLLVADLFFGLINYMIYFRTVQNFYVIVFAALVFSSLSIWRGFRGLWKYFD